MAINKKPSEFTQDDIATWEEKDKHKRKIKHVEFPTSFNDQGKAQFWIVSPNKTAITAITAYAQDKKIEKANDLALNSCVLAGDIDLLESDDSLYFGLLEEIGNLFDSAKKF